MFSFSPFTKNFKFLSLSPPKSLFYHSPTDDADTPTNRAPSPVANGLHLVRKLQVFRYSLILSLSFVASLFLSPHLSHLIGSVVRLKNCPTSSVPKRPAFQLVGKPLNPTVFTLSLPHSFSYLTNSLHCRRSSPADVD